MDDEEEDRPPFRWNGQAMFMLFFFMLAMAIPLMGVVWFARGYLSARPPAVAEKTIDTSALAQGLERMSEERFAPATTLAVEDGVELTVAREDLVARSARIAELAREAGGSALDLGGGGEAGRRLMLRVPASRGDLLIRAVRGDRVDFSAIPAGTATRMVEVKLRTP